jgi:hypothetical protein
MLLTAPEPFPAAVARLESKTPVAAALSSAQWQEIGVGLRDRAFFSARVNDMRTLAEMQSRIGDALTLTRRDGGAFMSRDKFIASLRTVLGAAPGDSGELTDLTSAKRLGLIYDFQVEDAMEYGRWLARQDPAILDAFPCNELIRVEHREVPRGYRKGAHGRLIEVPGESWPARWAAAGGDFVGGRMIARKDDPIWSRISRFGRPWPPFDFMSGMGLADVSREEAEQLGVIGPEAPAPEPQHLDFNHNLSASVPEATPALLERFKASFGDQVDVSPRDGKITWQGQRVQRLFEEALADPQGKWSLDLGEATPAAIAAAQQAGVDLADDRLVLQAGELRHALKEHGLPAALGPGAGETDPAQRPLTAMDFQLIPQVWRAPDAVKAGGKPGTLVFTADLAGRRTLVTFDRGVAAGAEPAGTWGLKTLYVKKEGGRP